MTILVCCTSGNTPVPGPLHGAKHVKVAEADLVVLMHMDGTWSLWKDRIHPFQDLPKRVPWDLLPSHVKRAIPITQSAAS